MVEGLRSVRDPGGCRAVAMWWPGGVVKVGDHRAVGVSEVVIVHTLTKYRGRAILTVCSGQGPGWKGGLGWLVVKCGASGRGAGRVT